MSGTGRTGATGAGGGMEDKAQRPGIGREEQVAEAPGQDGRTRGRSKEESTRRRPGEARLPEADGVEDGAEDEVEDGSDETSGARGRTGFGGR
ncbi:hypothetical protein GCM10010347_30970 [Streptomyces cirratus]|uniref:Pr1-like protein n=1 Tax=Streptomyces cirratus TaxID=68187 RepID=A0ABQ3EX50_9ACTN|nr:hypothetical protein [Streptomyces cirratus]GHB58566.1 hypothetical protein GCM10010347_30970 [Streptomyces cirratus]